MNEIAKQFDAAIKYARGPKPLGEHGEGMLAAIREDPYTALRHGVLADYLDETHGNHPLHDFIRSHFERGASNDNLWVDELETSYDGTHTQRIPVGEHSGFRFWLGHEGGDFPSEGRSSMNSRYVVIAQPHRVKNRDLRDLGYAMEFPTAADVKKFADEAKLPAIHQWADRPLSELYPILERHYDGKME